MQTIPSITYAGYAGYVPHVQVFAKIDGLATCI